jgi:uncharacterized protein YqjF (DUF2071 family)
MSPYPPHPIRYPVMFQGWECLTFLHWRYPPAIIRPLIPSQLVLDTCDGSAWIGLTPFLLTNLRPPFVPVLPWISRFPEMNVRTYVRNADGYPGIWFFTLEAGRLLAVIGARSFYRLPYRWAAMRVRDHRHTVEYESNRKIGNARARLSVRPGDPVQARALEDFLTARFRLYTIFGKRLAFADIEHPPWPLQTAEVLRLEQNVIEQSGVPKANGHPLVHFSRRVDVRIGRPQLAT